MSIPDRLLWLMLLGVAAICGCSSLPAADSRDDSRLVITGSSTVAPLVAEIGKRFEQANPGVRIDVQTGGSSRGMADARRGLADIGMVSRSLEESESDLHGHPLARDGICLIVHRDNQIIELTDEQVRAIYHGETTHWRDVDGGELPITVVNKAAGRSTLELFLKHFDLKDSEVQPDVVIGDNQQGIKTVAGNRGAIGYVSIGVAEFEARENDSIRLLPIGGVEPTVEQLAAGKFPLSRELNLVTRGKPTGLAKQFIEFAQSDAVHDLMKEQSFVPIQP